jgi:hypothetical protein
MTSNSSCASVFGRSTSSAALRALVQRLLMAGLLLGGTLFAISATVLVRVGEGFVVLGRMAMAATMDSHCG